MIPAYWKRNYYAKQLECNIDVYDAVVLQICILCIFLVEMLFYFVDFLLLLIYLGRCKFFLLYSYWCISDDKSEYINISVWGLCVARF